MRSQTTSYQSTVEREPWHEVEFFGKDAYGNQCCVRVRVKAPTMYVAVHRATRQLRDEGLHTWALSSAVDDILVN